jgi:hypothetical protein
MLKSNHYITLESFFIGHKITFDAMLTENIIHCGEINENWGFLKWAESISREGKILCYEHITSVSFNLSYTIENETQDR